MRSMKLILSNYSWWRSWYDGSISVSSIGYVWSEKVAIECISDLSKTQSKSVCSFREELGRPAYVNSVYELS